MPPPPRAEAEFATIPFEFPFAKLMQIIEEAVRDNLPLAVAIEELRRHGHPDLPRFSSSGFSSVAPTPSGQSSLPAATSQPAGPGHPHPAPRLDAGAGKAPGPRDQHRPHAAHLDGLTRNH